MTANVVAKMTINNGAVNAGSLSNSNYTMTGSRYIYNIQSVGTSYELLTLGDLTNCKVLYLENNTTASIQVATTNNDANIFATLSPNTSGSNFVMLPPSASNASGIYVKSSETADLIVSGYEK